ncbi:MAG: hypothetical protein ABJ320_19415 [Lentilitoribacter sp.]
MSDRCDLRYRACGLFQQRLTLDRRQSDNRPGGDVCHRPDLQRMSRRGPQTGQSRAVWMRAGSGQPIA